MRRSNRSPKRPTPTYLVNGDDCRVDNLRLLCGLPVCTNEKYGSPMRRPSPNERMNGNRRNFDALRRFPCFARLLGPSGKRLLLRASKMDYIDRPRKRIRRKEEYSYINKHIAPLTLNRHFFPH